MSVTCDTARDLIPLCADNTACADSVALVEEHIKICPDCAKFYEECKNDPSCIQKSSNFNTSESADKSPPSEDHKNSGEKLKKNFAKLSRRLRIMRNIRIAAMMVLSAAALVCIAHDIVTILTFSNKVKKTLHTPLLAQRFGK